MRTKEQGYVLAIDQASNAAGVTLWYNGELLAHTLLESGSESDPISARLRKMRQDLSDFVRPYIGGSSIRKVVFEGVRSRIVALTVGAFISIDEIDTNLHQKWNFVESPSWKRWAQEHGAKGKLSEIKGLKALRETGFPVDEHGIVHDDVADAVLIFKTWASRDHA